MAGYVIADVVWKDSESLAVYKRLMPSSVEKYGRRLLVRGGAMEVFSLPSYCQGLLPSTQAPRGLVHGPRSRPRRSLAVWIESSSARREQPPDWPLAAVQGLLRGLKLRLCLVHGGTGCHVAAAIG